MSKNISTNLEIRSNRVSSQLLMLFTILYVTFNLTGCVLLYKLVKLGPGLEPGGFIFVPIVLLIEDIIAEVYGYKISRALLWYAQFSLVIFSVCTWLVIRLPSPAYWHFDEEYHTIFDPLFRGGLVLFIAVTTGRFINIYALTKMKILVRGRFFWIRSILSTFVGGLVTLCILFGLTYGSQVSWFDLEKLFVTDCLIKILYAVFGGIPAPLIVRFIKAKYGIDTFDYNTNFNPFKLSIEDEKNKN